MPLPSYSELRNKVGILTMRLTELSIDTTYGVIKRPAVKFALQDLDAPPRHLVLLSFENIPQPGVVKRALWLSDPDVVLRARWDENQFLLGLSAEPEKFEQRIREFFTKNGLAVNIVTMPYSGHIESDMRTAAAIAQARKTGYQV